MRKLRLFATALLLPGLSLHADVDLAIGSGDGFLEINNIDERGWLNDADQGTYDAGPRTGDTIWELFLAVVENGNVTYFDGETTRHAGQRAGGGSTVTTPASFETTGISLPGHPDMTADMQVQLTQPVIGTNGFLAQADWTLTLNDTSGSPRNVSIACWFDADIYIDGNFDDNICAFGKGVVSGYTPGNPKGFVGLSNGPAPVNLNEGVLFDVIVPPGTPAGDITFATVQDTVASSQYWFSGGNFTTVGYDANLGIHPGLADSIQGDNNGDGLIDNNADIGAIIEVATTVPSNGSRSITFRLLYGLDEGFQPMPLTSDDADIWAMK